MRKNGASVTKVEGTEPVKRKGRRMTARHKLISAAYDVMSRKGLDGSTLSEIIDEAGVGVGSFYNHFASKEELAQAVFSTKVEEFGATLESIVRQIPDAALATCFAFRRLIEEAEGDKGWAAFFIQLEPSMQMMDRLLRKHALVGLQVGIDSGAFTVDNAEVAITAIHAIEVAMVKSMLAGTTSAREAHRSSRLALRLLGVPDSEAARLSRLSMAALRRELKAAQGKTA